MSEDETTTHHIRQRSSLSSYNSPVDKKNPEKRSTTRFPGETKNNMAVHLAKSPWWGGMYERLIKEVKKTLYKTLGKTHLTLDQLIAVVMDIERHLNNHSLTYIESDGGGPQVLTPNTILWGDDSHILEDREQDESEVTKMQRRLNVFVPRVEPLAQRIHTQPYGITSHSQR